MKNFQIYIPKEFYLDELLTPNEILAYSAQKYFWPTMNESQEAYMVNIPILCYLIYDKITPNKTKALSTAMSSLIDRDIIEGEKINSNTFLITDKYEFESGGYYTVVTMEELNKIKNPNMFTYFVAMIGSLNGNIEINGQRYFIGTMRSYYFSEMLHLTSSTISKYNTKLVELGLIYTAHIYNKETTTTTMYYGRPQDKDLIDLYIRNNHMHKATKANKRRSVTQKYNRYLSNPDAYTPEEIEQIRNDCAAYNEELDRFGYGDSSRKKDLSFFDGFDGTCSSDPDFDVDDLFG